MKLSTPQRRVLDLVLSSERVAERHSPESESEIPRVLSPTMLVFPHRPPPDLAVCVSSSTPRRRFAEVRTPPTRLSADCRQPLSKAATPSFFTTASRREYREGLRRWGATWTDQEQKTWGNFRGVLLEQMLRKMPPTADTAKAQRVPAYEIASQAPVRLIDARWLIWLAEQQGSVWRRRQELPEEAFIGLNGLRQMPEGYARSLRVLVLSQPWRTPTHPDPTGETLKLLANVLRYFLENVGGTYAVFVDYLSLVQCDENDHRTPYEDQLMKVALGGLGKMYAHRFTCVIKVAPLPEHATESTRPSVEGGCAWCFTESSLRSLVSSNTLDLAHFTNTEESLREVFENCKERRPPPLAPSAFNGIVVKLRFTSPHADTALVKVLYASAFQSLMANALNLDFSNLCWGDEEAIRLADVLPAVHSVRFIHLQRNKIGNAGLHALARAIQYSDNVVPNLVDMYPGECHGCLEGKHALAKAVARKKGAYLIPQQQLLWRDMPQQQPDRIAVTPKSARPPHREAPILSSPLATRIRSARADGSPWRSPTSLIPVADPEWREARTPSGRTYLYLMERTQSPPA